MVSLSWNVVADTSSVIVRMTSPNFEPEIP
jgi:hypothetical protein